MTRLDISDKITMIDDAFSSYLTNHNDDRLCKDLSDILSAFAGNKRFEVEIVHSKDFAKEPFFGMSIYPSGEYMSRFLISTDFTPKSAIKRHYTAEDLCDNDRIVITKVGG